MVSVLKEKQRAGQEDGGRGVHVQAVELRLRLEGQVGAPQAEGTAREGPGEESDRHWRVFARVQKAGEKEP